MLSIVYKRHETDTRAWQINSLCSIKGHSLIHSLQFRFSAVEQILKVQPKLINTATSEGYTALHIAAVNGLTDILLTLVKQVN